MDRKEYMKKWSREYRIKHKEEIQARMKQYYLDNKEKLNEKGKKYNKEYYQKNKETIDEKHKTYRKKYKSTPMGRALGQVQSYKSMDRKNGFGDVIDFDARWMVDNIYSKPCKYCGETDWHKLGCNRIDNSKPHTKDNVEPCCRSCNIGLRNKYYAKKG